MSRIRSQTDPNRYLAQLRGYYHYKRRVPTTLADVDARAPVVRMSLKTDDLALARRWRDMLEAAGDSLWASMIAEQDIDPTRRRYEAAVKRVEALGFTFHSSAALEQVTRFEDLARRLKQIP